MAGFAMEQWHDFFVAQAGAGAALAGLVFVAISINLQRLLALRSVQGRAIEALLLLVALLLVGLAALIPGQGNFAFGAELILFGLTLSAALIALGSGSSNAGGATPLQHLTRLILGQACALSLVAGGASLVIGTGGGLYWLAGGAFIMIVASMIGAWVLLVEILR